MSKYLLEIGTEELPYKFIPSAVEQLKKVFENFLNTSNIGFEKVRVYATPRRLAVIVDEIAQKSPDEEKIIKGPIKKVAYDENGNLSKAGLGFLNKNNLKPEDIYIENDYIHAKILVKGKPVTELLQQNVPQIVLKLQGSHFMRWAYNDEKFSRPIRWIVSILDRDEVKIKIIDKESSIYSRGHRFAQQKIMIGSPADYIETMRNACVIVDQNERKQIIVEKAEQEAKKLGAVVKYSNDLLEEVTYITEYPVAVVCEFDKEYLKLPEEVTVTVMAVHQRYFALYKDNKLINKFITMTNYIGDEFKNIKAGNLRVIKARLDDAVFFFNEDTKIPLSNYVEKLKGMTFQKGMGSVYDKTQRIITLSESMAKDLGANLETVERTAFLCKADLATSLVFEFTELQGFIGSDYARGEDERVVQGIKEHYFPLNAESETAKSIEGQIVGIADKLDNICAVFADGKKPTGSSDPLGVRRAALGIMKTVLDAGLKIDLTKYIKSALELLPVKKDCFREVEEFFVQRLIIMLSDKFPKNVLEACSINPLTDLNDYLEKVKALVDFDDPQMLECANRVIRILKDNEVSSPVNPDLFKDHAETVLFEAVNSVNMNFKYKAYLEALKSINPAVQQFFEDVLVMADDTNVKQNRLALISSLKKKYDYIADFSKL